MNLGQQIGPLPLGGWLIAGTAGIGIAVWNGRRRDTSANAVVYTDSAGSPLGTNGADQTGGVGVGAAGWAYQPPAPSVPVESKPTTNTEWYQAAFNNLVAKGYDAALVDTALRKYVGGYALDVAQWVIVRMALAAVGPLPEPIGPGENEPPSIKPPVPNTPTVPKPPVPPTKPPTVQPPMNTPRTVNVTSWPSKHSTLYGIAETFYGNGNSWPKIYNANRDKIVNPNRIYPGQVLVIP